MSTKTEVAKEIAFWDRVKDNLRNEPEANLIIWLHEAGIIEDIEGTFTKKWLIDEFMEHPELIPDHLMEE